MPAPNLASLAALTFRNVKSEIVDAIYNSNPMLGKLRAEGGFETREGGNTIDVNLRYAEDGTAQSFDGYDQVNVTPVDTISNATFNWKNLHVPIVISEVEKAKNRGPFMIASLLKAKIEGAKLEAKKKLTTVLFADGTGNGGKDPLGLSALIAIDPTTGTLGGINRATSTNAFWRNKANRDLSTGITGSALTSTSTFSATAYFQRMMSNQFNNASRGSALMEDRPNLGITTQVLYETYKNTMLDKVRYPDSSHTKRNLGFADYVMFEGVPIIWDPALTTETINSVAATSRIYLVNTNYMGVVINSGYDWKMYPPASPVDQYVYVSKMHWMGQLIAYDCSRLAVISGFTTNS